MAGPDKLAQALEPLQERLLYAHEYQTFGREVLDAAMDRRLERKYDLSWGSDLGKAALGWSGNGENFTLIQVSDGLFTLAASRTTEADITLFEMYAFGSQELTNEDGISLVTRNAWLGERSLGKIRLHAKDYGTLKRHEPGVRKSRPNGSNKHSFRLAVLTINNR